MDLTPINARLKAFAESVGDEPPAAILKQDGSPSTALMDFRNRHGLTLDWMITGTGMQFRRLTPCQAETAAYRVMDILRTCARALESDAPEGPGDAFAASQAIEVAIEQLGPVIDTLEDVAKRCKASTGPDSPTALYNQWKALRAKLADLVVAAGGDDPETPEFAALTAQEEFLCKRIGTAVPRTDADALAMLEWAMTDSCEGAVISDIYIQAQKAVVTYLRGRA